MELTEVRVRFRKAISDGNTVALESLLAENTDTLHMSVNTGVREIDFLLSDAMIQSPNLHTAYESTKLLFMFGADANKSYYTQSKVGFLVKASERSLELTKLFVENGAHINHDLFGKPRPIQKPCHTLPRRFSHLLNVIERTHCHNIEDQFS